VLRGGGGYDMRQRVLEQPLVQILVAVAFIQVRACLKAGGGEGFRAQRTAARVSRS